MMQIDTGKGNATAPDIWNWQQNVVDGKLQIVTKRDAPGNGAYAFWNRQVQQWSDWNAANPTIPSAPPPDDPEGNCLFSATGPYQINGPPYQTMRESFADAILIKQYNGAATNYIFLDTNQRPPKWTLSPLNNQSPPFSYVSRVCSQTP